ncbi:MAG: leucine-rich repeat-containing protein kinase family protein [Mariprofundaceae bacterium]|nr:leucine-rich repeat-containing protein kinase family protein [Mariprofundaceae bacterium]
MVTLEKLKSGQWAGAKHIKMACGLTEFPRELFDLEVSLEVLDLSGNQLSCLPDDFSRFKNLRILFLSDNCFESMPVELAECPELSMVGFKANRISHIPEGAFPRHIRWLILTDNAITQLPSSMGEHTQLQKLMLAGNQLTALPQQMINCKNLELLRISANQFEAFPAWLFTLPKLAWLAFAGNPCTASDDCAHTLAEIHWDELNVGRVIGEGASGMISMAHWQGNFDVALKAFKGEVTSDGFPSDEMAASIAVGQHDNLVEVIGQLKGHPEQKNGLLLALISDDYQNLAGPPCLDSCTRDSYSAETSFTLMNILNISDAIASAAVHLHQAGITHGDLYGHNILINDAAHCLLGDFGAATFYHGMGAELSHAIERVEVRAFACLLEELLERVEDADDQAYAEIMAKLWSLQQASSDSITQNRPNFSAIHQQLLSCRALLA